MRALVAVLAAAGVLLGWQLVAASSAQRPPRAHAEARVANGSVGPLVEAVARDGRSARHADAIDMEALKVRSGEAIARTGLDGLRATARANAVARSVEALGGRVTAYGVRRSVTTDGGQTLVSGRVDGLRLGDRFIGDVTEEASYDITGGRVIVNRGTVGLRILLDDGTDIRVAVVSARAVRGEAAPEPEPTTEPRPERTATKARAKRRDRRERLRRRAAPEVQRRLTGGGYAFPVYGERADFTDDWGGPRQIGPHQGNDIFAPLGTPVLAVADGIVRKVGTLPISGNRLWLVTDGGDAFFYAHLSAFSPDAVSGRRVEAGTVLGFTGNTGDAEPTPPHLHFEIHPGGMDEDAVNPHPFLLAWRARRDVPPSAWLQQHGEDTSERPGALVEVRDFIAGE